MKDFQHKKMILFTFTKLTLIYLFSLLKLYCVPHSMSDKFTLDWSVVPVSVTGLNKFLYDEGSRKLLLARGTALKVRFDELDKRITKSYI